MIGYRQFLNCDPPDLVRVWQQQPSHLGFMQPMSTTLLEMFVLSKSYFDRDGLIVATDDDLVVGFAHAGFGPDTARRHLLTDHGIICVLMTQTHQRRRELLEGLVDHCEAYLRRHAAREIHVGTAFPDSPFYLGLCGGSDLPGVHVQDLEMEELFRARHYAEKERSIVYERLLDRQRLPVDRIQLQHRRNFRLVAEINPRDLSWWDACVFGPTDRLRFRLEPKESPPGSAVGEVSYWDMGPLATRPQGGGMGMIEVRVDPAMRGQGIGTFMVAESLRHLQNSGITRVETQTVASNEGGQRLLARLGFTEITRGIQFVKRLHGD